jgi:hypothetical protein
LAVSFEMSVRCVCFAGWGVLPAQGRVVNKTRTEGDNEAG